MGLTCREVGNAWCATVLGPQIRLRFAIAGWSRDGRPPAIAERLAIQQRFADKLRSQPEESGPQVAARAARLRSRSVRDALVAQKKYPCASSQPTSRSRCPVTSSSTPSATGRSPRLRARSRTPRAQRKRRPASKRRWTRGRGDDGGGRTVRRLSHRTVPVTGPRRGHARAIPRSRRGQTQPVPGGNAGTSPYGAREPGAWDNRREV
jgi:hypothetical protein